MKVFLCLVCYLALLSPKDAKSEKIDCQVVALEMENGDYGTCCIIYRNSSKRNDHIKIEAIKKQILLNQNLKEQSKEGENSTSDIADDRITFDDKEYSKKKEVHKPAEPQLKNITFIDDRNAFNTPSVCPEGTMRDHNAQCTEPF